LLRRTLVWEGAFILISGSDARAIHCDISNRPRLMSMAAPKKELLQNQGTLATQEVSYALYVAVLDLPKGTSS